MIHPSLRDIGILYINGTNPLGIFGEIAWCQPEMMEFAPRRRPVVAIPHLHPPCVGPPEDQCLFAIVQHPLALSGQHLPRLPHPYLIALMVCVYLDGVCRLK